MVKHQKFGPHTSKLAAHLAKVHVKTGLLDEPPAPETAYVGIEMKVVYQLNTPK